jgi:hypothetical protein
MGGQFRLVPLTNKKLGVKDLGTPPRQKLPAIGEMF